MVATTIARFIIARVTKTAARIIATTAKTIAIVEIFHGLKLATVIRQGTITFLFSVKIGFKVIYYGLKFFFTLFKLWAFLNATSFPTLVILFLRNVSYSLIIKADLFQH